MAEEEEAERQYLLEEQTGQAEPERDRDYVSKIGKTVSDALGIPDNVPLYQMRARLIEEHDMQYDEEKDAVVYDVKESSQTVYSLESLSDTSYILHIPRRERKDMNVVERANRAEEERSLAVLTAIGTAMDEYDTDRIIVRTDHGWEREIDGDKTAEPAQEAYEDVQRYIGEA